jgi:hypothetical protein
MQGLGLGLEFQGLEEYRVGGLGVRLKSLRWRV